MRAYVEIMQTVSPLYVEARRAGGISTQQETNSVSTADATKLVRMRVAECKHRSPANFSCFSNLK